MTANQTPKKKNDISGWLVLDKPLGPSSAQVVGKVKYLLKPMKIGHGGTLDPLASGVLPLALGEATKTMAYILESDKSYEFVVTFGTQTTTDDAAGEPLAVTLNRPTEAAIHAVIPQFTGLINQRPPAVSALKVGGERAYKLVRDGQTPDLNPRPVMVRSMQLIDYDGESARFSVNVSKGTYIRSLGRDMALALNTVGHITMLRRTRHGPFTLEQAVTLESLDKTVHSGQKPGILPLEHALAGLPAYSVTADLVGKLQRGIAIPLEGTEGMALVSGEGRPVAIVEINHGLAQPKRVFNLFPEASRDTNKE